MRGAELEPLVLAGGVLLLGYVLLSKLLPAATAVKAATDAAIDTTAGAYVDLTAPALAAPTSPAEALGIRNAAVSIGLNPAAPYATGLTAEQIIAMAGKGIQADSLRGTLFKWTGF